MSQKLFNTLLVLFCLSYCAERSINITDKNGKVVGGILGEISELYVHPDFRSLKVGKLLLDSAVEKGNELNWRRLEVGTPPLNESPRTIKFYEDQGFTCTGSRMRRLIQT